MITSLHLRNFKCFENQVLKIAPLTLLSGYNGMGKSTTIQSLLLLRQSYLQGILKSKGLALNGEFINIGTGCDALFQDAPTPEEIEFAITTNNAVEASWTWDYEQFLDVLPLKKPCVVDEIYKTGLFTDQFHYLSAERIVPQSFYKTSQYKVRHRRQLGVRGEYAVNYLLVFGEEPVQNDQLHHPEAKSSSLKSQVEAWMGTISPGIRPLPLEYPDMDLVNLGYEFKKSGETVSNKFRAVNVGFGITNFLPVIIAILTSDPGTLLLLENPEAHLHPKGQSQIGDLLAKAAAGGVQVIVETHSDHLLNGVRVAVNNGIIEPQDVCIQFFERPKYLSSVVVTPTIDKNGRLDNWPEGFFDEWDKCLDALLEPKEG